MKREQQWYTALGRRIREARERAGMRQIDLALEIGYDHPASLSRFEHGHAAMDAYTYERIRHVLRETWQ